jgi:hypothetical protein
MITNPRYTSIRVCSALAAAVCLASQAASSLAQSNQGSFTLKVSEKEMNLEHPDDKAWQHYLMWDLGFQRMTDRNMPFFELTNNATSNAAITEFRITIGDTRFHFADDVMGTHAMLAPSTPGFNISSTTAGGLGDELVIAIGNGGLQPGGMLRFKVDLAVDAAFAGQFFQHPDFRTVFFDMNGLNVYDGFLQQTSNHDNAKASAVFDPPTGPNFVVGPLAFNDETVGGLAADFFNDNYRRYGEMDPVRTFLLGGNVEIPEPSAMILALVAMGCGLLGYRRVRR